MSKKRIPFTLADAVILVRHFGADPYTIWSEEALNDPALAPIGRSKLDYALFTYHSDTSDPKHTITKDGKVIPKCYGFTSSTFLYSACVDLNLKYESYFGRGRQAQAYASAIIAAAKAANLWPPPDDNSPT